MTSIIVKQPTAINKTHQYFSPTEWRKMQSLLAKKKYNAFARDAMSAFVNSDAAKESFYVGKILIKAQSTGEIMPPKGPNRNIGNLELPEEESDAIAVFPSNSNHSFQLLTLRTREGEIKLSNDGVQFYRFPLEIIKIIDREWEASQSSSYLRPELLNEQILEVERHRINDFDRFKWGALSYFLSQLGAKSLNWLAKVVDASFEGSVAFGYMPEDNSLVVFDFGANILIEGLYNNFFASQSLRCLNHECGHQNYFFQLKRKQYKMFKKINMYRKSIWGFLKKPLWLIAYLGLNRASVMSAIKTHGVYKALRYYSRRVDSLLLGSKKGWQSYVTFYSATDMAEDFAEQYSYYKAFPKIYEHLALQDDTISKNLALFKSLDNDSV